MKGINGKQFDEQNVFITKLVKDEIKNEVKLIRDDIASSTANTNQDIKDIKGQFARIESLILAQCKSE